MPIIYLALIFVVGLGLLGLAVMVKRMTTQVASQVQSVSHDPDALQKKLIPLLAYLALVSILIKICVF